MGRFDSGWDAHGPRPLPNQWMGCPTFAGAGIVLAFGDCPETTPNVGNPVGQAFQPFVGCFAGQFPL